MTAAENQTVIELEDQLLSSALRGFNSDESSERNSSSDSKERAELFPSPIHPERDQEEPPSPTTYTPSIVTTTNMSPFDSKLEYALTKVFMIELTHPIAMCLEEAFIRSFDDFRSLDMADVNDFVWTPTKGPDKGTANANTSNFRQKRPVCHKLLHR